MICTVAKEAAPAGFTGSKKGEERAETHPIAVENPDLITWGYSEDLETNVNIRHIGPAAGVYLANS